MRIMKEWTFAPAWREILITATCTSARQVICDHFYVTIWLTQLAIYKVGSFKIQKHSLSNILLKTNCSTNNFRALHQIPFDSKINIFHYLLINSVAKVAHANGHFLMITHFMKSVLPIIMNRAYSFRVKLWTLFIWRANAKYFNLHKNNSLVVFDSLMQ